ncbi:mucin-binding protein, partial [Streptococcus mitis]
MSKNVKVRYVDKATGNVITNIKNDKAFGEKDSENRYTAAKDVLINSDYNVTDRAYSTLSTTDDKYYRLVADNGGLATGSAATTGTIDTTDKVVTFVYEETVKPVTPTTGKGVVHFKKKVSETVTAALTGYDDITLEGNVGDTFSSTDVNTRITALKNAGYEIIGDTFTTGNKTIDTIEDAEGQTPSQEYTITVKEKVVDVTEPKKPNDPVDPNNEEGPKWPTTGLAKSDLEKEVTRTINYFKKETADGEKIADAQPTKVDKVLYKRTATYNLVSKTVTYSGWTATADDTHTATSFSPVKTPVLAGYVADFKEVTDAPAAPTANGEVTNMTREVVYTKIGSWVPKIPGKTPTPIPYPND